MTLTQRNTLGKLERVSSKRLVDRLFAGGNPSMAAFPLRAVYMALPSGSELAALAGPAPVSILVSVPKRRLHHAVDRNRMKRQIREAYRVRKHALCRQAEESGQRVVVAFVCISDKPCATPQVERAMQRILCRIGEQLESRSATRPAAAPEAPSAPPAEP